MSQLQLLNTIPLDELTDEHIYAALAERISEMVDHGGIGMEPTVFWREQLDLANYHAAVAWWPKDAPQTCALPTPRELCLYVAGPKSAALIPAFDVLQLLGERCIAWLNSEDRDPSHANESAAERKRRLGRDRVRQHRQLVREVADEDPHARHVRELHTVYIATCQARKEALAAIHDEHDPIVEAARVAWEEAKAAV